MKTSCILKSLFMLFFAFTAAAQQGINYKAIIHDADGDALVNTVVTIQFTILENGTSNVFRESHNATTDPNGIIIVNIGEGTLISGDFNAIDWGSSPHFLKTEIDKGEGLTDMGTTEFKAVPYALHAKTAEGVTGAITETQNLADVLGQSNDGNAIQIKNIAVPTNPDDAATKAYVDALEAKLSSMGRMLIKAGLYTVEDADGNIYSTVIIGSQAWIQENLKTTKYNDGTNIPRITDNTIWTSLTTPGYCWYENDPVSYSNTYGALYNSYTVETEKLCPTGWHVPTDAEWIELIHYVALNGYSGSEGRALKVESGWTTFWGTDEFGFTALPGGLRYYDGTFGLINYHGYWWCAPEGEAYDARYLAIFNTDDYVFIRGPGGGSGLSVRCLKD